MSPSSSRMVRSRGMVRSRRRSCSCVTILQLFTQMQQSSCKCVLQSPPQSTQHNSTSSYQSTNPQVFHSPRSLLTYDTPTPHRTFPITSCFTISRPLCNLTVLHHLPQQTLQCSALCCRHCWQCKPCNWLSLYSGWSPTLNSGASCHTMSCSSSVSRSSLTWLDLK